MWGLIAAAGVGGIALWELVLKKMFAGSATVVTPGQHPATPSSNPLSSGPGTLVYQVKTTGSAAPAAQALHSVLKQYGANPAAGTEGSAALLSAVVAFQVAANADHNSKLLSGPLPTTGLYDMRTSAALTMYTNDPIPPSAIAPKPVPPAPNTPAATDFSTPGDAATAGYNLFMFLAAHGDDKSPDEQDLVSEFQSLVNTDPKFPGPASSIKPILVGKPLAVSAMYDELTAQALKVVSGNYKAPGTGPFTP